MLIHRGISCYYLRFKEGINVFHFDTQKQTICNSYYENNRLIHTETVCKNVLSAFSVNISKNNEIYIFYQDKKGNIYLKYGYTNKWKDHIIQQNNLKTIHNVYFHSIINENGIHLLYNSYSEESKYYDIVSHQMYQNGKWGEPEVIDKCSATLTPQFTMQAINENLYILYYQSEGTENIVGYREYHLPTNKWSNFKTALQTKNQIVDYSFMTTDNSIHALYIIRGAYASQLIYKKKTSEAFSVPLFLVESRVIHACSIFKIDDQIWAIFSIDEYAYSLVSYDNGDTFSRAPKYKTEIFPDIIKATYINNNYIGRNDINLNSLLVDVNNPGSTAIVTDIYPHFFTNINKYNGDSKVANDQNDGLELEDEVNYFSSSNFENKFSKREVAIDKRESVEEGSLNYMKSSQLDLSDQYDPFANVNFQYIASSSQNQDNIVASKIRNHNESLFKEILEKDNQIIELMKELSEKSNEIVELDSIRIEELNMNKSIIKEFEKNLSDLSIKYENLKKEYERLQESKKVDKLSKKETNNTHFDDYTNEIDKIETDEKTSFIEIEYISEHYDNADNINNNESFEILDVSDSTTETLESLEYDIKEVKKAEVVQKDNDFKYSEANEYNTGFTDANEETKDTLMEIDNSKNFEGVESSIVKEVKILRFD